MKRTSVNGCDADIAHFEEFTTRGVLRGGPPNHFNLHSSWLPTSYTRALLADRASYIVWSYDTPIAWYGARGWVVPAVKYSRTTTRHQSAVEHALRNVIHCATLISERGVIR